MLRYQTRRLQTYGAVFHSFTGLSIVCYRYLFMNNGQFDCGEGHRVHVMRKSATYINGKTALQVHFGDK